MVLENGTNFDIGLANLVIEKALSLAVALKAKSYTDEVFDVTIGDPYLTTDQLGERTVGATFTPINIKLKFPDAVVPVFDAVDSPSRSADKVTVFRNGEWLQKFRDMVDAIVAAAVPPDEPVVDTSFAPIDDAALFNG